jgi:protocatechuate 3,4-dioxygenase beta subunit
MKKYSKLLALFVIISLFIMGQAGCPGCRDTTKPNVIITSPANNSTVSGIVTIQATANDNVGVVKVEFYIDGNKVGEDTSSPYEYSWNTDNLQYNSTHTIQAKAYDNAGNVGESPVITVTIGDSNAPEVTITNPHNGDIVSGTVLIQAQVTERSTKTKAPSGVAKVEFYIDDNKVREDTESPYTYDWDTTNLTKNSLHVITAKAYDKAGNIGKDEVTVMIGEVSQVVGVIESPAGITPTDFEVVNIAGTTEVAQDGTFTLTVVQDFQGVVSAVSKTKDFALFSINLKTYAPFASKLIKGLKQKPQKQGVNIGLAINAQSTAEALVFLNPLFATSDPDKQNIIFPIIANDPKVAELANVINQVASSPDPYSEPTFINAYKEAVNSVYNSLPVEYKVSTKSLKSPVDKKVLVLKYPENGGYIELADLDLTKVNFVNNSIKVDFKDAFPGVGVDYIVNIRELFKYQFKTLDDLTAEPHDPWSVFEITSGGTNAVMRLQSDSSTEYADIIGKLASDVLDYFINTTEIQVESNKIYEVSLYSGGFGLGQNNNSTNDKRYIRNSLMAGDKQPLTYVLNALGFNLFIASFDFLRIILPIDEMGGEYFEDSFKSIFMEHIKNQFNWFNTDSDPPKDTEILNWAKNIFADFLSGLADKALTKKAVVRLLKTIAKWLTKAVDIRDKISVIGTLSHRVIDLAHTTPLDRVIVVTGDALPPKAPTNLQIQSVDCNKISLTWRDNSNFEKRYKIERKVEGGNYSQIATVSSNTTSYTDTGLTPGATYYYRIKAYNNAGDSDYSNEASATTLSGQGTIQGTVKDTNNQPIQGATVSVEGTSLQTTTNSQGYYQIANVPAGTRTVTASKTGYNSQSKTVNVVAGQTITVDFQLQLATGTIQGTVKDTNNQPIQGATVSVEGTSLQATTNSQGYYQITDVPAGNKTVTASKSGYNSQSKTVNVVAGQTVTVDFQLQPVTATGRISGIVYGSIPNTLIYKATVKATGNGRTYSALTSEDGRYELRVPTGTYTVTVSKETFNDATISVTVNSGETKTQDFHLTTGSGGTISNPPDVLSWSVIAYTIPSEIDIRSLKVNPSRNGKLEFEPKSLPLLTKNSGDYKSFIGLQVNINISDNTGVKGVRFYKSDSPNGPFTLVDNPIGPYLIGFAFDSDPSITPGVPSKYYTFSFWGDSGESSMQKEPVRTIPLQPCILSSPSNGATVGPIPTFSWNAVPGADRYSIQVWRNYSDWWMRMWHKENINASQTSITYGDGGYPSPAPSLESGWTYGWAVGAWKVYPSSDCIISAVSSSYLREFSVSP